MGENASTNATRGRVFFENGDKKNPFSKISGYVRTGPKYELNPSLLFTFLFVFISLIRACVANEKLERGSSVLGGGGGG